MAIKSTKVLNLDIAGVDIAIEKGTNINYLIEVNKGPGIIPNSKTSPELKAFSDYINLITERTSILCDFRLTTS